MSDCHTVHVDAALSPADCWRRIAVIAQQWCGQQGIGLRDAVVIVPFAQLIDPARRAFAAGGGWQPRVETTSTWAAALGPPVEFPPGALSGSATLDGLTAAQWLRRLPALAHWETDDPRAFGQAVTATVSTALALRRVAHAHAPAARDAFWDEATRGIHAASRAGPDALELSLAGLAVEWARMSPAPSTDRLYGTRPGALIWVDAGGADALAASVAAHAGCACLRVDADAPAAEAFDVAARRPPPRLTVAEGLEGEARAVATEVIETLNEGHRPVALIALDRALMRRVRALLDRRQVSIADETGWALSTTRAAGCVMSLLKAAAAGATQDEVLEWLKSLPADRVPPASLQQLERAWRAAEPVTSAATPGAAALWERARRALAPLQPPGRRSLDAWLRSLGQALAASGASVALASDSAGQQVLASLRWADDAEPGSAIAVALRSEVLDAQGFRAWVDRTLEAATFLLPPTGSAADVVLTPLQSAALRPFAAVVLGGADERSLLAPARHEGLLAQTLARELGLDTPATRLERERLALAQLLRVPRITFIHRRLEGAEPVAGSPALDALALVRRRAGLAAWDERESAQVVRQVAPVPVERPAPAAPHDLPARLSASALESLRACPYRFFARSMLRLREADELEEGVDKRDYGNWLHAVLDLFHRSRASPGTDDVTLLREAADAVTSAMAVPTARLLPFRIGFEVLVPAYLQWLHAREARGLVWSEGEFDVERLAPQLEGTALFGRIDRIDRSGAGSSVIDYKTGSVARLQAQLRDPLEDTQLAFYALLMNADAEDDRRFEALYLALDDPKAPRELAHANVGASARAMLAGLAADLAALRGGAGLGALGEGSVCDHCEARGLCRRDHWGAP